jgi:16S rRNA (uracil1498-N3)-methyltransferase
VANVFLKATMQRHRFYAPPAQINDTHITLADDEAHHLARVLRLPVGARVFVLDGCGHEYACEISQVGKRQVELIVLEQLNNVVESPLQLTLAVALLKGDKFDWVVQKATELGVTRIVPLLTEHSDIRHAEARAETKLQRWQRITLEALKQCGRRQLVEFAEPVSWSKFCPEENSTLKVILSERGGQRLKELPLTTDSACIAVASEGGWSEAELDLAAQHDFLPVHLGARILRAETAAITGVTLMQQRYGDL